MGLLGRPWLSDDEVIAIILDHLATEHPDIADAPTADDSRRQPELDRTGPRVIRSDMIVKLQRWLGQPALGTETVVVRTCPVRGPVVSRSRLSMKSSFMCQSAVSMKRVRLSAPPRAQANPA